MNLIQQITLILFFSSFSCNNTGRVLPVITPKEVIQPITIIIQPFNDFPKEYLDFISIELRKIYPKVQIKLPIQMPSSARNQGNTRYRADSLIRILRSQTPEGYKTIGLTTIDISTTLGAYADWGVMGLGFLQGESSVVSSYRVRGLDNKSKLFKVVVHELGHNYGLQHCTTKTCIMKAAEGRDIFKEELGFCDKCKSILIKSGWKLK
jgi:archaemetzincin